MAMSCISRTSFRAPLTYGGPATRPAARMPAVATATLLVRYGPAVTTVLVSPIVLTLHELPTKAMATHQVSPWRWWNRRSAAL